MSGPIPTAEAPSMSYQDLGRILQDLACRDMDFHLEVDTLGSVVLRVQAERPNQRSPVGAFEKMKGRKWLLSQHMTASEVVQTAFAAALHFEEHELREAFRYRGQAIFGPHYDVDDLVALSAVRGRAGAR